MDLTRQLTLDVAQQIVGQVVESPSSASSQTLIANGALTVAVATVIVRTGGLAG